MAPRNKLLELAGNKPIIVRAAETAIASGADPVIVVTGFEHRRIGEALRGLDVTLVHNPDFAQGLSTSLRAGVKAVPANLDGVLICLGDMPEVDFSVIHALIAAFTGPSAICVPVHRGSRGNPVLWGRCYFDEMMAITGDVGARSLMARHAEHVAEVEVGTSSIFADIDASADLARIGPASKR
jgi:molybdenum cofactor cytidylyltransferase